MRFMKKSAVAAALGISLPTLRAYEERGLAPFSHKMFGRYFYEEQHVRKFIDNARRSQEASR